ncbi:hypothetical protein BDV12DRAFT_203731 [Aspergillus spectabilis]
MRQTYSLLSQQFENEVLRVSPEFGQPGGSSRSQRYTRRYLAVDDRLEAPPTQALLVDEAYFDKEWTYTIDLDRELLAVDKTVHFNLFRLPHDPSSTNSCLMTFVGTGFWTKTPPRN